MYRGWNAVLQAVCTPTTQDVRLCLLTSCQVDNGDTKILKLLAARSTPDLNARDESGTSVLEMMEERGLREEEAILLGGRSPSPKMQESMRQLREFVRQ